MARRRRPGGSVSGSLRLLEAPCFYFNGAATAEIYTLSLHDALPIFELVEHRDALLGREQVELALLVQPAKLVQAVRSEEHTSELQSHVNLVCRLLLEKKKTQSTR